ncbi:MAG: CHASE2 domain-containing protein, partial [Planctomycetota bacterium]
MAQPVDESSEKKEGQASIAHLWEYLLPLGLCAGVTVLAVVLWSGKVFDGFERLAYDNLFRTRRSLHGYVEKEWQKQASEEIVIIEYDDLSTNLLRIKGTPPRAYFSKVIERSTGMAKVVGFDYYFPRESYPDSRTAEIDKNVRYWVVRLLFSLQGLQLDPESPARGLSKLSNSQFLTDMGFFREPEAEELEGIDLERWAAFKNEVMRRQEETAGAILAGEKKFDEALRELDPGFVAFLDDESQD